MKVLVTGANGFVGRHVVAALVRFGHLVYGLDCASGPGLRADGIRGSFIQDVSVPFDLTESFDVVVHLAAYNVTHVGDASADKYFQVNVRGVENLLKGVAARRHIYFSTVKVYARAAGLIDETGHVDPPADYEKSKWLAEEVFRKHCRAEDLTILRSVNIIGPGQMDKAVVPVFFRKAIGNLPIEVFAPRRLCLQFLDVEDAAGVLSRLVGAPQVCGVFNLATAELVRMEDLVMKVRHMTSSRSEIVFSNEALSPETRYSGEKIKKALGWDAGVTLEQSLKRCFEYYAAQ